MIGFKEIIFLMGKIVNIFSISLRVKPPELFITQDLLYGHTQQIN